MGMTDPRKVCLLSILEAAQLADLLEIAKGLKGHGWTCVFLFPKRDYLKLAQQIDDVTRHGFAALDYQGKAHRGPLTLPLAERPVRGSRLKSAVRVLLSRPWRLPITAGRCLAAVTLGAFYAAVSGRPAQLLQPAAAVWRATTRHLAYLSAYKLLLERFGIDIVVVSSMPPASDRHPPLAAAARLTGRKVVLFSNVPITTTVEALKSHRRVGEHKVTYSPLNRAVAALYGNWCRDNGSERMLRATGDRIVAAEAVGTAPGNPWHALDADVDCVLVPNEATARLYRDAVSSRARVLVTGRPSDDRLQMTPEQASERRSDFARQNGWAPDRPIVLCAWPADHTRSGPLADYGDFNDICARWAATLVAAADRHSAVVIVSIHPKMSRDRIAALLPGDCIVRQGDIEAVVPVCDVFVAASSSTLYQALAMRKRAINFDLYERGQYAFEGARDYELVSSHATFEAALDRALADRVAAIRRGTVPDRFDDQWASLDGQATRRVLDAITSIAAGR